MPPCPQKREIRFGGSFFYFKINLKYFQKPLDNIPYVRYNIDRSREGIQEMKQTERMAIKANVKYTEARTNEIMVLGEKGYNKLAKVAKSNGKSCYGYKTGCWDDEAREYWWMFIIGKRSNPYMSELVSNNID